MPAHPTRGRLEWGWGRVNKEIALDFQSCSQCQLLYASDVISCIQLVPYSRLHYLLHACRAGLAMKRSWCTAGDRRKRKAPHGSKLLLPPHLVLIMQGVASSREKQSAHSARVSKVQGGGVALFSSLATGSTYSLFHLLRRHTQPLFPTACA